MAASSGSSASTTQASPPSFCRVREGLCMCRVSAFASEDGASALLSSGVTHVVSLAVEALPPAANTLTCLHLPLVDDIGAPLHEHLEPGAAFIYAALQAGSCVCVCCADAVSCGPALVLYYLMRHEGATLAEALQTVRRAHADAQPNIGFVQRLLEAEAWLLGAPTPSLTVQEYKWHFLDAAFPDAERRDIIEGVRAGRAEINRLLA